MRISKDDLVSLPCGAYGAVREVLDHSVEVVINFAGAGMPAVGNYSERELKLEVSGGGPEFLLRGSYRGQFRTPESQRKIDVQEYERLRVKLGV